jgi:hypothetical protein
MITTDPQHLADQPAATALLPEPPDGIMLAVVLDDGTTPIMWRDDEKGHRDWAHLADVGCWYTRGGMPFAWSQIGPRVVRMYSLTPYEVSGTGNNPTEEER